MINQQGGNYNVNTNIAHICGEVIDEPVLNHRTYGEAFYTFCVGICRSSGYEDQVIVMASERILSTFSVTAGVQVEIHGQIRTYNEDVDGHNRLNIVVFARELSCTGGDLEPVNDISLEGFLCKKPISRTSPMGRKICDLMLAVNRMYNKSDYIPCIAWGRNAVYSATLNVGDKIAVCGRLQSRQYRKKCEDGQVLLKTAYEVSVLQLETFEESML
ncbi:MAG: single-stranded DNA-binding protein [Emergencia sp.]